MRGDITKWYRFHTFGTRCWTADTRRLVLNHERLRDLLVTSPCTIRSFGTNVDQMVLNILMRHTGATSFWTLHWPPHTVGSLMRYHVLELHFGRTTSQRTRCHAMWAAVGEMNVNLPGKQRTRACTAFYSSLFYHAIFANFIVCS
jgi:hypothetical protein